MGFSRSKAANRSMWLHADLAGDVSGVGDSSDVIFNEIHRQSDNNLIALNTSTGVFTLPAGRQFMLEAQVYPAFFQSSTGFAFFEWVLADNSLIVGCVQATTRPMTATGQHSIQPIAKGIVETSVSTDVKLRCVSSNTTFTLEDIGNNAFITEIV